MKFPRIITRRRAKWTGLAATVSVAVVMIASYWLWLNYSWKVTAAEIAWSLGIRSGSIYVSRNELTGYDVPMGVGGWKLRTKQEWESYLVRSSSARPPPPFPYAWLPQYKSVGSSQANFRGQRIHWQRQILPLWMPLILVAMPTGILFYRDRKPKPGQCRKCRYDLAGLTGDKCPECGTRIATTDSTQAPTSAAEGENGVGLGENGVG
jgi:hypothetical protein